MCAPLGNDFTRDPQLADDIELATNEVGQLAPGRRRGGFGVQRSESAGEPFDFRSARVTLERRNLAVMFVDLIVKPADDR